MMTAERCMGLAAVVAAFVAGCWVGCWVGCCAGGGESVVRDTVTVVRWDTLRVRQPVAVRDTVVRTERVRVVVRDTVEGREPDGDVLSIVGDSVEIPITQTVYEDSSYRAWVSGYRARLDSIDVRHRTVERVVSVRERRGRLSVGLTGGYGVGLSSRRAEPFVGIGITYSLWPN